MDQSKAPPQPPQVTVFGGQNNQHNVALPGGTIHVDRPSSKEPPEDLAELCPMCATANWSHARFCSGCGWDFEYRKRWLYRALLIVLLFTAVALLALLAIRT